jgi:3-methyladenine DNA glycosylase/8-oxoguanine DNA glycosylase
VAGAIEPDGGGRGAVRVDVEVRPPWPYRRPRAGFDGVARVRGAAIRRLVHVEGQPVLVGAVTAPDRVRLAARAPSRDLAEEGIARWRFALGVDDDLAPFYERFRFDPLVGPLVRREPARRVHRRPEPFEALAWAVTEQLIESERAAAIQREIVRRHGRRGPEPELRDLPAAATVASLAPAELERCGLAAARAQALIRAAREVAAGRVDLRAADPDPGWRRLRSIPGIGAWTIEILALHGQGRLDVVPAGDLAHLKLVGRLTTGRPGARATEDDVRAFYARFDPWAGLAAEHLLAGWARGAFSAGAARAA